MIGRVSPDRGGPTRDTSEDVVSTSSWACTGTIIRGDGKGTGDIVHCNHAESIQPGDLRFRKKVCPKCGGRMVPEY